jgi:transcriptional regulator with XRE-family HTH domain
VVVSTSRVASLGEYLREQRNTAELSLRQLAEQAGVSNPYLSQVERGLRKPSAEVLNKIATALQISSEHLYIRAGLLDEESTPMPQVMAAIQADPALTARQRQSLLDIYAAFVAQNVGEPIVVDVHTGATNGAEPSAVPVGRASEKE